MKTTLRVLLGIVVLVLSGCRKQGPAKDKTVPSEAAIVAYLQQNSMGMKIVEFKSLTITGDTATGVTTMQEAESLYALKVTWEFTFRKDKDGWTALSHKSSL